jgi:hypothetical protein
MTTITSSSKADLMVCLIILIRTKRYCVNRQSLPCLASKQGCRRPFLVHTRGAGAACYDLRRRAVSEGPGSRGGPGGWVAVALVP